MAVAASTLVRDILFFIKDDISTNVTDPISSTRGSSSSFVMTSFPQRAVEYPLIVIKMTNAEVFRAGMQTTNMDYIINIEVRVWARNQKEKDELYNDILERLRTIQFTASTGSIANNLHDFNVLSSVEVDEEGTGKPKSRIMEVQYKFFN